MNVRHGGVVVNAPNGFKQRTTSVMAASPCFLRCCKGHRSRGIDATASRCMQLM